MSDAHGHGDKPFLAHHFEDEDHQFDSGKLGIWAFLVTEVLFFSGLFCAYAIYRSMHPDVFQFAANALDTKWGAINTSVLILSSLTAAWAVRNAQLGQKGLLSMNLFVTILCAFGFMGIKYQEYSHKFHYGIYPGVDGANKFEPLEGAFGDYKADEVAFIVPAVGATSGAASDGELRQDHPDSASQAEADLAAADHGVDGDGVDGDGGHGDEVLAKWDDANVSPILKDKLKIFFGIYYCMTGLHGIHVLLGIVVFMWLLSRSLRGHFTPTYYGPIDYAALYWHLVDLIWIYLFPLLYLIN